MDLARPAGKQIESSISKHVNEAHGLRKSKHTSAILGGWGKNLIIGGAVAVGSIVLYSISPPGLLENIGALNCASAPTQNSVSQIAEQNNALVLVAVTKKRAVTEAEWDQLLRNGNYLGDKEGVKLLEAARAEAKSLMKYTLDVVRTTRKDNETGNIACAANLQGSAGKYGTWTLPITYTVERTSDGKPYVTVYGLKN